MRNRGISTRAIMIAMTATAIVLMSLPIALADQWELVKNDTLKDIRVYYRTIPNGNIEFKAVTNMNSSLSSFVALFADTQAMPEWVYGLERTTLKRRISPKEVYSHSIHKMPFPFKNRDSIIHSFMTQDPKTLAITIRGTCEPDAYPMEENYIRITTVESFWKLAPRGGGNIEVTFQGYGEPGGTILPSIYRSPIFRWLCKFYLWQLPYNTLKNMKVLIKRDKYQAKVIEFIKEPV